MFALAGAANDNRAASLAEASRYPPCYSIAMLAVEGADAGYGVNCWDPARLCREFSENFLIHALQHHDNW
ncbi:hypothetical protein [Cupriavidus necator]|uniref:hypothetical protein n=1 Tax=Cupriavidus necator TaxID=106590 RepID=UPI000F4E0815|nr:hypothetical protein [Cupriavidus necator]